MTDLAVTIDFHNTLARCDEWFEIEVRTLVPGFLTWWADMADEVVDDALHADAITAYRQLRRAVIDSGIERDAADCLVSVTRDLGFSFPDSDIASGLEAIMRPTLELVEPQPGAVDMVKHLNALGIPVGIVSSAVYHPFLEWTVEKFGLAEDIGVILSSASCGHYKSRPLIYEVAAQALGGEPASCVHIGDSLEYDVRSAGLAGMRTVWVNSDGASPNGVTPDLTVSTLEGLAPRLIKQFSQNAP